MTWAEKIKHAQIMIGAIETEDQKLASLLLDAEKALRLAQSRIAELSSNN
jgi:hypothetical protein